MKNKFLRVLSAIVIAFASVLLFACDVSDKSSRQLAKEELEKFLKTDIVAEVVDDVALNKITDNIIYADPLEEPSAEDLANNSYSGFLHGISATITTDHPEILRAEWVGTTVREYVKDDAGKIVDIVKTEHKRYVIVCDRPEKDTQVKITVTATMPYESAGHTYTVTGSRTITVTVEAAVKEEDIVEMTISELIGLAKADWVYFQQHGVVSGENEKCTVRVRGIVTEELWGDGYPNHSFMMSDGVESLYVYAPTGDTVEIGDYVEVTCVPTTYYGIVETSQKPTVKVLYGGQEVPAPRATYTIDELYENVALDDHSVAGQRYILEGIIALKGTNTYTLQSESSDKYVEIYYKSYTDYEKAILDANLGAKVQMETAMYDSHSAGYLRILPNLYDYEMKVLEGVSDETKVANAKAQFEAFNFKAKYEDGDALSLPSALGVTVEWSFAPAEAVVDGKIVASAEGTVALTATISCGSASDQFEKVINIAPKPTQPGEEKGTAEHPFNATEAVAKCLEVGETASEERFYVAGTLKAVTTAYNETYGNISITLTDGTTDFLIYRLACTAEEAASLVEGKYVVVEGQLINYKGNTPEMTAGGTLVSVGEAPAAAEKGTAENPFNATEAVAKCLEVGETASEERFYVAGTLKAVTTAYNETYGNISITLTDGTTDFLVYRLACTAEDAAQLVEGCKVVVEGQLINYKGNTPEMTAGGTLVSVEEGEPVEPEIPPVVEDGTLEFSFTTYFDENGLANQAQPKEIALDAVVTYTVEGGQNSGKLYKGNNGIAEARFYKSETGKMILTIAEGYEFVSVKAVIGSANYDAGSEVELAIVDNKVEVVASEANFNIKSLSIVYKEKGSEPQVVEGETNLLVEGWYDKDGGETYAFELKDGVLTLSKNPLSGKEWSVLVIDLENVDLSKVAKIALKVKGPQGKQILVKYNDNKEFWVTATGEVQELMLEVPAGFVFDSAKHTMVLFTEPGAQGTNAEFEISEFKLIDAEEGEEPVVLEGDVDLLVNGWFDNEGGSAYTFAFENGVLSFAKFGGGEWSVMAIDLTDANFTGYYAVKGQVKGPEGEQMIVKLNDNGAAEKWITCTGELQDFEIIIPADFQFDATKHTMVLFANPGAAGTNNTFEVHKLEVIEEAPEHGTQESDPLSATEALAKALEIGQTAAGPYYVAGKIKEVTTAYSEQYGNISITLTDGETDFLIFRLKCTAEQAEKLVAGNDVLVSGKLVNYQGKTPEMTSGGELIQLTENAPEEPQEVLEFALYLEGEGNNRNHIEGAGAWIWIQNSSIGMTGDAFGAATVTAQCELGVVEAFFSDLTTDYVRVYVVMPVAPAADQELAISLHLEVAGKVYEGTVTFVGSELKSDEPAAPEVKELLKLDFEEVQTDQDYNNPNWKQEKFTSQWDVVSGQMRSRGKDGSRVVNMYSGYSMALKYTYTPDALLENVTKVSFDLGNYFGGAIAAPIKVALVLKDNSIVYLLGDASNFYSFPVTTALEAQSFELEEALNVKAFYISFKSSANSAYIYLDNLLFEGFGKIEGEEPGDETAPVITIAPEALALLSQTEFYEGEDLTLTVLSLAQYVSIVDDVDGQIDLELSMFNLGGLNLSDPAAGKYTITITAKDAAGNEASEQFEIEILSKEPTTPVEEPEKESVVKLDFEDGAGSGTYSDSHWKQQKYTTGWVDAGSQMNSRSKDDSKVVNITSGWSMTYMYTYTFDQTLEGITQFKIDLGNYFSNKEAQIKIAINTLQGEKIYLVGDASNYYQVDITTGMDVHLELPVANKDVVSFFISFRSTLNSAAYLYLDNIEFLKDKVAPQGLSFSEFAELLASQPTNYTVTATSSKQGEVEMHVDDTFENGELVSLKQMGIFGGVTYYINYRDGKYYNIIPDGEGVKVNEITNYSYSEAFTSFKEVFSQLTAEQFACVAEGVYEITYDNNVVTFYVEEGLITKIEEVLEDETATYLFSDFNETEVIIPEYEIPSEEPEQKEPETIYFANNGMAKNAEVDVAKLTTYLQGTSVTEVSNVSKVFGDYTGHEGKGIRIGTSKANGTFTIKLSDSVNKVVIKACGWATSDKLTVNGIDCGAMNAYTAEEAIEEYVIEFETATDTLTFQFTKRGFIQEITLYFE